MALTILMASHGIDVVFWGLGGGSWAVLAGYVLGVRMIYYDQQVSTQAAEAAGVESPAPQTGSVPRSLAIFSGAAIAIVVAAPIFAHAAEQIAEKSGLGRTFVGTTLVALCTTLPELVSTLTAIRMGAFDLAIGLDREAPMQTALGLISPTPLLLTTRGAPHVGATGWLFHLDSPNLMLSRFRPAANGADGVQARLLECAAHGGPAEFRCVRDPQRAVLLDAHGTQAMDVSVYGDAVQLDVPAGDLFQVRIDFQ